MMRKFRDHILALPVSWGFVGIATIAWFTFNALGFRFGYGNNISTMLVVFWSFALFAVIVHETRNRKRKR